MNQPIRTAICSFGMSGKVFHAPFLHVHQGFQFYGAVERSTKSVHHFYEGVKSFSSIAAMLHDEAVELVIVNTPNYTHYDIAMQALMASKHVLVEKPFTVSVSEGEELIELAEKQRKIITVYQNRRYDSDYKTVKDVLAKNLLGTVTEAEIHYDRYKPTLSNKAHKETAGAGTGTLYDLGSHLIDQAFQLFGLPNAVFADIATMRPISQVDDYFELLLYYANKRVRLKATNTAREPVSAYIVHGAKGSFIKSRADVQENALQAGKLPGSDNWGIEPESEMGLLHTETNDGVVVKKTIDTLPGNYMEFYNQLHDAIRNNAAVPVLAEDAVNVIRIIEYAQQSSVEKRVIEVVF